MASGGERPHADRDDDDALAAAVANDVVRARRLHTQEDVAAHT
jgi:hypothetical protein